MKNVKVVIGANFGDEGKGLMTDYFAGQARDKGETCLVVCSNGGAQRGHTVRVTTEEQSESDIRHVFHHFGSGALEGAATFLPHFYIVNPMHFAKEYEELNEAYGSLFTLRPLPPVFIHPECKVSTPYDMILNQILEENRGDGRHGSCGMGIWETLVRDGISFGEMINMSDREIKNYLQFDCKNHFWNRLSAKGIETIREGWLEIIDDEGIVEHYLDDLRLMQLHCNLADVEIFDRYDQVIFENGQGLLLDRCRREYGHNTTPSNTGFRNPAALLREYAMLKNDYEAEVKENQIDVEVCYVTRTYLTRHGAGRFDGQCSKAEINPDMYDETNVPNPHQGTIRYGKLDEKALLRMVEDYDSERLPEDYTSVMTLAVTHINEYESDVMKYANYLSDGELRQDVKNA